MFRAANDPLHALHANGGDTNKSSGRWTVASSVPIGAPVGPNAP